MKHALKTIQTVETIEKTLIINTTFEDMNTSFNQLTVKANAIAWQYLGLNVGHKGSKELETFKARFKTGGDLFEQRSYKTAVDYILKAIDAKIQIKGKVYTLDDIKAVDAENLPFAILTEYKNKPAKNKPDAEKKKKIALAKKAIDSADINTQDVTSPLALAEMANVLPEYARMLQQAQAKQEAESFKSSFPDVTADNLDNYTAELCEKIKEVAQMDQEKFTALQNYMDDLQEQINNLPK